MQRLASAPSDNDQPRSQPTISPSLGLDDLHGRPAAPCENTERGSEAASCGQPRSNYQRHYEINFTKYFYQYKPLRSLDDIRKDIMAIEQETDGLLKEVVG